MVKVIFLGTGTSQGVPQIGCECNVCASQHKKDKKLRSSIFVQTEKVHLVIDTGPDFRYQMLRARVKRLDAILFTHGHKDHTAGFDDIRGFNYLQKKPMDVYCDTLVEKVLKNDFYYCFAENKYPGVPELNLHIIDETPFYIQNELITPIKVLHYKLPVLGFRIQDFTYITDANYIAPEEKEKIMGSKVLVINALRKETHISHFNLKQAISLAQELEVPEVYFTHQSHQLGLYSEVNPSLPTGISLAYDGLEIDL